MLTRLARGCYRHRRLVAAGWAALLAGLLALGSAYGGEFDNDTTLPGSESQQALDLLEAHDFPTHAGESGQLVFTAADIDDPAVHVGVRRLLVELADALAPVEVVSPYGGAGSRFVNHERTIAFAPLHMGDRSEAAYDEAAARARALVAGSAIPGARVELGGNVFAEPPDFSSETAGFLAAMVVLLVAFGSVLAMGLPLVTAACGILAAVPLVSLLVRVTGMPSYAVEAVAMIGIGVGIDYALLVVTRYREGLAGGRGPEDATVGAVETAGRAVLVAGTVVMIAVLGMLTVGLAMIRGLAVGISLGVLTTMLASVTLLPALLGFVGTTVDRLALPGRRRDREAARREAWRRWSHRVQGRPWTALVVAGGLLVVLALPATALRHGFGDAGNRPASDTTRRAYDLVADGFGPGANGPLLIVAELPGGPMDFTVLMGLWDRLVAMEGLGAATPPLLNDVGDAAVMRVFPGGSPQEASTEALVRRLRAETIPEALAGTTVTARVTGATAAAVDFGEFTSSRLPWFTGSVLVLSFLLLAAVFRSLLVPLKAVVLNLLAVGACYGVVVAVFQWGWGLGLLGVGRPGPIDAWVPTMLFAVIFGLSMDYEVFLLTRIGEDYGRHHDNAAAVAEGVAATGRVITAAAAVMVCVFGAFALGSSRSLKMFGLGLAVAVLLDATVVRLVLVPATMELLGDRNWWLPAWLGRVLPAPRRPEPAVTGAVPFR
jgi:RND superfamily putative drug exporter